MDGEKTLSKECDRPVKDCFEKVNRCIFAFKQTLDDSRLEPVARGDRKFRGLIRHGTSNVLSNLSYLMTIPNNLLQGEIKQAGQNTIRFVVNTTVGILGIFDPAAVMGFEKKEKERQIKEERRLRYEAKQQELRDEIKLAK